MKVLVVGRLQSRVDAVTSAVRDRGYEGIGTITDTEALSLMTAGGIDLLVLGNGVESDSRAALKQVAAEHDIETLEKQMGLRGPAGFVDRHIVPRADRAS